MRHAAQRILVAVLLACVVAPAARAQPALQVTHVVLDGYAEPHTPPQYNKAITVRYAFAGSRPRAIAVLIPGLSGGAGSLDLFARALLRSLGPDAAVWVHERRSNLLEDHTGLAAALARRQAEVATGYYLGTLDVGGRRFREVQDVGFMAYWGLAVHLGDARAAVLAARATGARVLLGGHSLGAMLAALYAAHAFPDGPGYRDLDGLIFLDGVPGEGFPPTIESFYLDGVTSGGLHVPGVRALEAGRATPYLTDDRHSPEQVRLFNALALAAAFAPEEPFVLPEPLLRSVPLTNEAALGIVLDDETQVSATLRARVGAPLGRFERVPDPRRLTPTGFIVVPSLRPLPGRRLVGWQPYDVARPRAGRDQRQIARAAVTPHGDFAEWYLPWRLVLDVALAGPLDRLSPAAARRLGLTQQRLVDRPLVAIGAGRGLVRTRVLYQRYLRATAIRQATITMLPEYAHLDVVLARENAAATTVARWVQTLLQ